jgi:hypothetical protein
MTSQAPQVPDKTVSEVRNGAISFVGKLDEGELLTGTPTMSEATTSDLTFSNAAVNTSIRNINGVDVRVGMAVQFKVIGGTVLNSPYTMSTECDTDATPAQTLIGKVLLEIEAD